MFYKVMCEWCMLDCKMKLFYVNEKMVLALQ